MNYRFNNVIGWGISEGKLHTKDKDGMYKLLTMDIDFGNQCSLHCPHCFKRNFNQDEDKGRNLTFAEIKDIILQAKALGLESVKILGAGEPFENEDFLEFLRFNTELGIHTCVFTKGHVLGCDDIAKKYNFKYGINTSKQLVEELYRLKTSILLGFNSFNESTQLQYCGLSKSNNFDYFSLRNRALELLIEAGFNKINSTSPTRLALIASPYKLSNIEEIKEIYKWGHEQNIYVAICPSTNSGMGHKELERVRNNESDFLVKSIQFYTDIYVWAIKNNIISFEAFKKDGVSLYPGGHPCNQTAAGLYVILDGKVMVCPGLDGKDVIVCDDIRTKPLKQIWMESPNYTRAQQEDCFNFQCVAREKDLFNNENFYNKVYSNVLKQIDLCK